MNLKDILSNAVSNAASKLKLRLRSPLFAALLSIVGFSLFYTPKAYADPGCQDSGLISGKLFSDICWSCILPIRVAGIPLGGSRKDMPSGASKKVLCACDDELGLPKPGVTTSMWEPARLVEFQRVPGCSSVLGGHRMFPGNRINQGNHGREYEASDGTFVHYHYYAFPLLFMLDLFAGGECNAGGYMDLDLMYLSELDPTWNIDALSFFTTPEAATVANPLATLACIPDAISVNAGGEPIDRMFWCAGSWGTLYPLSGHVMSSSGIIHASSLLKVRVLAALHRRGLAWKTMGDEGLCGGEIYPMLPRSQYKYTITYPIAETDSSHTAGESTLIWGNSRKYPGIEDPIYTIFRWKDCCQPIF